MPDFMTILLVLFYFLFPVFIIYLTHKSTFLNKVGAVVLAYIFGLILGNMGIMPRASNGFRAILKDKTNFPGQEVLELFHQGLISQSDIIANQVATVQNTLIIIVILFAIPLLLFSLDLKKWLKIASEALLSLALAMASLLAAVFIGFYIYKDLIDESWKISGMLIGLYTGGAPNLAAISTGLKVNANTFLLTNTYDMVIGGICLVFLMTVAQRFFNLFLPSFSHKHAMEITEIDIDQSEDMDSFVGILSKVGIVELLKGFGVASIVVVIGGGISMLVPQSSQMVTAIVSITTLGLLFSNWKVINKIGNTFQLGMYFIIVFSLVVASMGNLANMFHIEYLHLFSFVALVVIGSMAIHVFLAYLFKIDTDTTIISMTALTYSPPFVPVVAGALKNKNVIISGLTVGILGYAIGNYLGLAVAYFLR